MIALWRGYGSDLSHFNALRKSLREAVNITFLSQIGHPECEKLNSTLLFSDTAVSRSCSRPPACLQSNINL